MSDHVYVDEDGRELSPEEIRGYVQAGYVFEDVEEVEPDGSFVEDDELDADLEAYAESLYNELEMLARIEKRPLTAEEQHTVAMGLAEGIPGSTSFRGLYELTNRKPPDLDVAEERQAWQLQRLGDLHADDQEDTPSEPVGPLALDATPEQRVEWMTARSKEEE